MPRSFSCQSQHILCCSHPGSKRDQTSFSFRSVFQTRDLCLQVLHLDVLLLLKESHFYFPRLKINQIHMIWSLSKSWCFLKQLPWLSFLRWPSLAKNQYSGFCTRQKPRLISCTLLWCFQKLQQGLRKIVTISRSIFYP